MSRDGFTSPLPATRARSSSTPSDLAGLSALAEELLDAALATRRSEALLVRSQAAHLAWLSVGDRAQRCGFSSLSRLALELLGLGPRTVRERLCLHRLLARFPAVERAFLEGRMSACQALAAAPILEGADGDGEVAIARWIETAGRVSVRALRYEARARRAGETRSGTRESFDPSTTDAIDPSAPDAIDPQGRVISFAAPVGFQVVFDQTIDLARKVLGGEAPIHECIAAILAETGWTGVGSTPQDARRLRPPGRIPVRPRAEVPVRPEAIDHARVTLDRVRAYVHDVLDLVESGEPRSPRDALHRLRQLQLLRSPQRVLFAHLIRDLRRTFAMDLLGYRSMAELVEDRVGLSERSARNRVAESLLFEGDREIEGAVGRGEISLMQAHLIRRLGAGTDIEPFVERAREVTWRQLRRECRLLELLRKCGLGRLSGKPLSPSRVEESLIEALGGDREAIERNLGERGVSPVPADGASDPAENPIVMERLEALVEMLAGTMWDDPPVTDGPDRQTSAARKQRVTIRFWAPNPTADDFEHVIDRFGKRHTPRIPPWAAVVMLFAQVKEEWEREDPERRPVRAKILKRDRYRCVVPGCGRRSRLEDHHLHFRSRGGGNEAANRATLCHSHHNHMVHKGYVRITGKAPHALRFDLGCAKGEPTVMVLRGEKKISTLWS